MMKYQIIISHKKDKKLPVLMKKKMDLQDAAYWQKRVQEVMPDTRATVQVAR